MQNGILYMAIVCHITLNINVFIFSEIILCLMLLHDTYIMPNS
jgi:hypothetical protein